MESLRMCVACRKMFAKNQLIRFVRVNGGVFVDESGKVDGRGCYLCKQDACIAKAIKGGLISKSIKVTVTREAVAEMLDKYVNK